MFVMRKFIFVEFIKFKIIFCTEGSDEESPNLVLHKIFLLKYLLMLFLIKTSIILYQLQFLMKICIISLVVNNTAVIEMRPDEVFAHSE